MNPPPDLTPLGIVGPGRLGTALAAAFRGAGIEVAGPAGRGEAVDAPVVLLCVPDASIAEAAGATDARLVGHSSGATPLTALGDREAFGFHPLQTVTGPDTSFAGCGCAIAGTSERALATARALAEALGMEPFEIADDARAAYHAAASIASNFLVTLEAAAEAVAGGAGIEPEQARRLLAPLVRTTVANWERLGPAGALTGPVARGDEVTIARQRRAVESAVPDLLPLFDALVERTREVAA
jgi:predicted short-subunit dehydrogenase-like oxidoreductase (DUF2520 family)